MHVCFVCTGNICRSPMAEIVFTEHLRRLGFEGAVKTSSCGTGAWHVGEGADHRAASTLAAAGYPTRHTASQVDARHLEADLLVALDRGHERALRRLVARTGGDPSRIRLLRSFDPSATGKLDVPDPYYGGNGGFARVLQMVEDSMPGLIEWVTAELDAESVPDEQEA